jgi:hypothetical protein
VQEHELEQQLLHSFSFDCPLCVATTNYLHLAWFSRGIIL